MKCLIVFVLVVAAASAFRLEENRRPIDGGRIANGEDAAHGQFPYQVGLQVRRGLLSTSWCGASLISNNWVLTAAHCVNKVRSVTVYLGSTVRTVSELKFTVKKDDIIVHEGYDDDDISDDIALIRIPSVVYTKNIQPVPLPKKSSSYSTYTGEAAIASGWGLMGDSATGVAEDLQWARLTVVPNRVCQRTYKTYNLDNVCLKTPDFVSTCQGDSGGPLVLESTGVQIGLTSFGSSVGCEKGYPVAFTRVTNYLDWIESRTGLSF